MLCAALFLVASVLALPGDAQAQDEAAVRQMFEAGEYQQVIDATTDAAAPEALYVAAQSRQRLGATSEARDTYGRLAARPEADGWHFIGLSGQQLLDDQTDAALASARQATGMARNLSAAHYQVGLVLAKRRDWQAAAAAFDQAATHGGDRSVRPCDRRALSHRRHRGGGEVGGDDRRGPPLS